MFTIKVAGREPIRVGDSVPGRPADCRRRTLGSRGLQRRFGAHCSQVSMRVRLPALYFHAAPPLGGRLSPVLLGLPSRVGLLGDPAPTGLLVTPGPRDVVKVVALGSRAPAGQPRRGGRLLLGLAAAMRPVALQLRSAGESGALPQRRALPERPVIEQPPGGRVT